MLHLGLDLELILEEIDSDLQNLVNITCLALHQI